MKRVSSDDWEAEERRLDKHMRDNPELYEAAGFTHGPDGQRLPKWNPEADAFDPRIIGAAMKAAAYASAIMRLSATESGKWYHVSPHRLPDGTVLTPGGGKSPWGEDWYGPGTGREGEQNHVWIGDGEWMQNHGFTDQERMPYVYEVEPSGTPRHYYPDRPQAGYVVPSARITRMVSDEGDTEGSYNPSIDHLPVSSIPENETDEEMMARFRRNWNERNPNGPTAEEMEERVRRRATVTAALKAVAHASAIMRLRYAGQDRECPDCGRNIPASEPHCQNCADEKAARSANQWDEHEYGPPMVPGQYIGPEWPEELSEHLTRIWSPFNSTDTLRAPYDAGYAAAGHPVLGQSARQAEQAWREAGGELLGRHKQHYGNPGFAEGYSDAKAGASNQFDDLFGPWDPDKHQDALDPRIIGASRRTAGVSEWPEDLNHHLEDPTGYNAGYAAYHHPAFAGDWDKAEEAFYVGAGGKGTKFEDGFEDAQNGLPSQLDQVSKRYKPLREVADDLRQRKHNDMSDMGDLTVNEHGMPARTQGPSADHPKGSWEGCPTCNPKKGMGDSDYSDPDEDPDPFDPRLIGAGRRTADWKPEPSRENVEYHCKTCGEPLAEDYYNGGWFHYDQNGERSVEDVGHYPDVDYTVHNSKPENQVRHEMQHDLHPEQHPVPDWKDCPTCSSHGLSEPSYSDPDENVDPFDPRIIGAALKAVGYANAIMRLSQMSYDAEVEAIPETDHPTLGKHGARLAGDGMSWEDTMSHIDRILNAGEGHHNHNFPGTKNLDSGFCDDCGDEGCFGHEGDYTEYCNYCNGTGVHAPPDYKPCIHCNGTGVIS